MEKGSSQQNLQYQKDKVLGTTPCEKPEKLN